MMINNVFNGNKMKYLLQAKILKDPTRTGPLSLSFNLHMLMLFVHTSQWLSIDFPLIYSIFVRMCLIIFLYKEIIEN